MAAQGWCPSTYRLFDAPDGALARIKVPGGIVDTAQLRAVAEVARWFGNGAVEITNRANLQVRGLTHDVDDDLRRLLSPVGLSAPTAAIASTGKAHQDQPDSLTLNLPPLSATFLVPVSDEPPT